MKGLIFINGKFVRSDKAVVPVTDRGFLYGDGVFETMRSYGGKVFKIEEHIARLWISLKIVNVALPYSRKKIGELVYAALRKNGLTDAYVKIIVTRGQGRMGVDIPASAKPTVIIYVSRFDPPEKKLYEKGVSVSIPCIRRNEESFTVRVKSLNYLDNILARAEVRAGGFYEPVFLNSKDVVTEGATSNVFIVKKGVIYTTPPSAGLLPGVTRGAVIALIGRYLENDCLEKNISFKMLMGADEVFLTNSTNELVPVVRIGRYRVGKGRPGPVYKLLHVLYSREVSHG